MGVGEKLETVNRILRFVTKGDQRNKRVIWVGGVTFTKTTTYLQHILLL